MLVVCVLVCCLAGTYVLLYCCSSVLRGPRPLLTVLFRNHNLIMFLILGVILFHSYYVTATFVNDVIHGIQVLFILLLNLHLQLFNLFIQFPSRPTSAKAQEAAIHTAKHKHKPQQNHLHRSPTFLDHLLHQSVIKNYQLLQRRDPKVEGELGLYVLVGNDHEQEAFVDVNGIQLVHRRLRVVHGQRVEGQGAGGTAVEVDCYVRAL